MRLACILSLFVVLETSGQSWFTFRNIEQGVNAPVFDAAGVPLVGEDYHAELWGAATPETLAPLVLLGSGNTRLIKPFATDGYVVPADGGYLVVPTVSPNGYAWLQMRAWDSRLGATYEEVEARGDGGYGESLLFYAQGSDPFDALGLPATLVGLQSFNLRAVPEPSAFALLVLGALLVFFQNRSVPIRRTFEITSSIEKD
jgi:hypothetical protein